LQQQSSFDLQQQQQPSSTPALAGMLRRLSHPESDSASIMQQYGGIPNTSLSSHGELGNNLNLQQPHQMSSYQHPHFPSSSNSINPMMGGNIPGTSLSSFSSVPSNSNTNQGIHQQQVVPPPPPYSQQQSTSMGMMPTSTPFSGHQIPSSSSSNMHYMMGPGPSNFGQQGPQPFINSTQMTPNQMSFAAFQQQQQMAAQMAGSQHHGGGPPVNLMGGGQQQSAAGGGGNQLPPNFPSGSQGGF
uniref:Uncharacterized protein n=1 Tax=Meloidogyne javanica TaxID=6303 RepID=A0A915M2A7_MELJA